MLLGLASAGCSMMPPQRIPVDRLDYLEAINTSWKEQLLNNLVRLRKGDSLSFLELTSVVTTYNWTAGATSGYTGGLSIGTTLPVAGITPAGNASSTTTYTPGVTGGATFSYYRTPAITYSPIRGEILRKIMMDPIALDTVLKSLQVDIYARYILPLTVESITIESKSYRNSSEQNEFIQFVRLFNELLEKGIIRINIGEVTGNSQVATAVGGNKTVEVKVEKAPPAATMSPNNTPIKTTITTTTTTTSPTDVSNFYLTFDETLARTPHRADDLKKFKDLLGKKDYTKYQIRFGYQLDQPKDLHPQLGVIFIQPRSIMQILSLLSKPEGLALNGLDGRFQIIESTDRPKEKFATIKHDGLWFYISNNDNDDSKKVFSLMVLLLAMSEQPASPASK